MKNLAATTSAMSRSNTPNVNQSSRRGIGHVNSERGIKNTVARAKSTPPLEKPSNNNKQPVVMRTAAMLNRMAMGFFMARGDAYDPSSATAATRRTDCNSDAMPPLQHMVDRSRCVAGERNVEEAAHGWVRC